MVLELLWEQHQQNIVQYKKAAEVVTQPTVPETPTEQPNVNTEPEKPNNSGTEEPTKPDTGPTEEPEKPSSGDTGNTETGGNTTDNTTNNQ